MGAIPNYITQKRKVEAIEVQKSYIVAELSKFASENAKTQFADGLREKLAALSQDDIGRLTEALSVTYRKNGVFRHIGSSAEWFEVAVPVDKVYLTRTNKRESDILEKLPDPWSLGSLVERLKSGEVKGLEDFQDRGGAIVEPKTIGVLMADEREESRKVKIIDGMHRLPALVLRGNLNEVDLYLGVGKKRNKTEKSPEGAVSDI